MKTLLLIVSLVLVTSCLPSGDGLDEDPGMEEGYNSPIPGDAEAEDPDDMEADEVLPPSAILPVPAEVRELLDAICRLRPKTMEQKEVMLEEFIGEKTGKKDAVVPCQVDETDGKIVCKPEYKKALFEKRGVICEVDETVTAEVEGGEVVTRKMRCEGEYRQENLLEDMEPLVKEGVPCEVDQTTRRIDGEVVTTKEVRCAQESMRPLIEKAFLCEAHTITKVVGCEHQYREVLVEEDQGDVISNVDLMVSRISNGNSGGRLYVEPSPDGRLYWAARKWTLAETSEIAKEAMEWSLTKVTTPEGEETEMVNGIGIASYGEAFAGEGRGRLNVRHPVPKPGDTPASMTLIDEAGNVVDAIPWVRYQVCMVVRVPPQWILDIRKESGPFSIFDHEGSLRAVNDIGDILIEKKGAGVVEVVNGIGKIDLVQEGSGEVSVEGASGAISISQKGPGRVIAYNANETLSVTAGANVPVELATEYGAIDYFVQGGGTRLTDSWITSDIGAINLHLDPSIGFNLDAQTELGSISLPSGFPQPEKVGLTGEKAAGGVRGGGGPLFLRSNVGSICLEDIETGGQSNDCAR